MSDLTLTREQVAAIAARRLHVLSYARDMADVGYDTYVSIEQHSPALLVGEVLVALAQRVEAMERRAHTGAAGCRKNVYDAASSPCTCQAEVEREVVRANANERLLGEATARIAPLEAALNCLWAESSAILSLARDEIREVCGNTNLSCFTARIVEAKAVLDAALKGGA